MNKSLKGSADRSRLRRDDGRRPASPPESLCCVRLTARPLRINTCIALAFAAALAGGMVVPASASTGSGHLTASIVLPVAASGSGVPAEMTCTANTKAKTYFVRLQPTVVGTYTLAGSATIAGYKGPGSYRATFTMTITGNGKAYGGAQTGASVVVNTAGGAVRFAKTATGAQAPKVAGKTVAGQVSWTCPVA